LLPICPDLVQRIKRAALASEDVLGGLAPDEGDRFGVQRSEELGREMVHLVVCHLGGALLRQRQSWLLPIKRPALRLLIDPKHDGEAEPARKAAFSDQGEAVL
jgi:hypothetical protein